MHSVQANGAAVPALGLGTWKLTGDVCRRLVAAALEAGYRHVDTAQAYGNEAEVGEAIANAPVARDDVFLTTKVWTDRFTPGDLERSAEESLKKLRVDAVDLLLLHWPNPEVPLKDTLDSLARVKRDGRARHVGVSNFTTGLIEEATALCPEPLAVNQVEYHPYLGQKPVLEALRARGMALTAYSPIAQGKVVGDPVLKRIGERHGRDETRVALRWLVQQEGVIAIPRTSKEERVRANLSVFDFALTDDEMAEIHGLARPEGRLVDPGWAPAWDVAA